MEPAETTPQERSLSFGEPRIWMRGLFALLLMFAFGVGQSLLFIVAVVQFIWLLFAGEPNRLLAQFGKSLSLWLAEIGRFLSCATEEKPFPWAAWPPAG